MDNEESFPHLETHVRYLLSNDVSRGLSMSLSDKLQIADSNIFFEIQLLGFYLNFLIYY